MAERERRLTRPYGGVFHARSHIMNPVDIERALRRIGQEIVERNNGVDEVILVGLQTGGAPLAQALARHIEDLEGEFIAVGLLDVVMYRDDFGIRPMLPEAPTDIPFDVTGKVVVLVDDVLFTGRTIRAALDALGNFGRARCVQLAVMIDRGHRELPIRPDYVGREVPTRRDELVNVGPEGVSIGELIRQ